jgi:chemotaxis protein CheD
MMTPHPHPATKIHIIEGEYKVVSDCDAVLSTVLGSCVAVCLRDATAGVGGMNHFLLPGDAGEARMGEGERYGVHLMEVLVNGLLKMGARRERLEGKVFGGARMLDGLSDIGARNGAFARRSLANEGVRILAEDLGGRRARRIEYFPVSGRARQFLLAGAPVIESRPLRALADRSISGALELF